MQKAHATHDTLQVSICVYVKWFTHRSIAYLMQTAIVNQLNLVLNAWLTESVIHVDTGSVYTWYAPNRM